MLPPTSELRTVPNCSWWQRGCRNTQVCSPNTKQFNRRSGLRSNYFQGVVFLFLSTIWFQVQFFFSNTVFLFFVARKSKLYFKDEITSQWLSFVERTSFLTKKRPFRIKQDALKHWVPRHLQTSWNWVNCFTFFNINTNIIFLPEKKRSLLFPHPQKQCYQV